MAIYAISDLHLALSIDKPMDVFGQRWFNYMEKLKSSWEQCIKHDDYIVIPGDISWATYLEQAYEDFRFIDRLPGIKIISKGNHDYWWSTLSKLEQYINDKGFSTIRFMHNNSFKLDGVTLCGTRGWKCPGDEDFNQDDLKIFKRELKRLELSLESASSTEKDYVIVALHYPPFNSQGKPTEFIEIMLEHNVKKCLYGHVHGGACASAFTGTFCGIQFKLVSADYLNFKPVQIFPRI